MIKNIKKISIIGGGSAGWMAASMIKKTFPEINVSVIESPNIPTIGVGESTLGGIRMFCHYLGIEEQDFMKYTDASYKMSIKFTDFYEKNSGSFHYPFGEPYLNNTYQGMRDWFFKKAIEKNTPNEDFVRCYFPAAALFEQGKFSENSHGKFDNFNPDFDVAYHFDAVKFALWLRDRYCFPRGVEHILGTVAEISQSDQRIDSVILDDGSKIEADLYVDCTGFRSLLIGDAFKTEWVSYDHILPNNRAWACQVPYKNKEKEIEGFTNCTAIENGWCWNTPLWSRLGTGYVYSDKFVSPEDALEEFKNYLCSDKMVIPRSREEIDALSFRDVPFRVGIHKQTFVKNVVAIGLSAGFIEPLESNGLFSVHEFLFKLMKIMKNKTITQWDRDVYNCAIRGMYNNFVEFVAMHYALSVRDDTAYWRAIGDKTFDNGLHELKPTMNVGFHNFTHTYMFTHNPDTRHGITYVSAGMNRPMMDEIDQRLYELEKKDGDRNFWRSIFCNLEENRERWKFQARKELSLYEYLRRNIYEK